MCEPLAGVSDQPVRLVLHGRVVACRAIIFDKDGTLVDPTGLQSRLTRMRALRAAAQATRGSVLGAGSCGSRRDGERRPSHGADPISEEQVTDPDPADGGQAEALPSQPGEEAPDVDEGLPGPGLLPGVDYVLDLFRNLGLRMAIATGDRQHRARATMDALGVGSHFTAIIGIDDVVHGKPAPDMVRLACERLGCSPGEVIIVGDSPADLMMGRAAGVAACIGVTGGFSPSARLGMLADAVLPTVAELPGLLLPLE
jgi:phosphoglycolate phosphatase